ncbi:hypothetical protein ACKVEX_14080 [Rhodocyclaceae bacterium SMB388]
MARQDYKRNERLHQIALRSDWRFSARLALGGVVLGVWLVPALLAGDPATQSLGRTIAFLAWIFSAGFAGIAVYRFFVQRRSPPGDPAARTTPVTAGPDPADEDMTAASRRDRKPE